MMETSRCRLPSGVGVEPSVSGARPTNSVPVCSVTVSVVNFANGSHPWGVQPFHYTVEYYQHVADAITSAIEAARFPRR